MAFPWFSRTVLVALAIVCPFRGRAAEGTLPVYSPEELGYSVAHWTVGDGLPQRVITSMAQIPGGYLWCGTTSGLLRFDGGRFQLFSGREIPELKDVEVLELLCDSDGRLWIGGIGGQIVVYEQGRFRRLGEAEGTPQIREPKFGQDPEGDFWINGRIDGMFYRFGRERFEAVTWPGLKPNMIDRFRANPKGEIWAVHEQERSLVHLTAHGAETYNLTNPQGDPEHSIGRFFDLQDGRLAVNSKRGIYAFDGSEWKLVHPFSVPVPSNVLDSIQDRVGNFWLSAYQVGLTCIETNGFPTKVSLPDTATDTYIRCLLLDSEGNVWAGGDDGLYRLRRKAFRPQPVMARQGLETYSSAVVEDAKGDIWLFDINGWYRRTGQTWSYTPHGHKGQLMWMAAVIQDGSVLVGYRSVGNVPRLLEQITPTGQRSVLATFPRDVQVIHPSRSGAVWIGAGGLWKLEAGRLQSVPVEGTVHFGQILALAEDREGRLFVGDQGNGLFQQTDHGWQKLTTRDDVGSDRILGMHFDREETLWIATHQGIARWKDGRWFARELDSDLHAWVRAITSDDDGYLWMISALGVNRITLKSLNDLAEGRATELESEAFTREDGLPTLEGTGRQASLLRASDGRIWAATQKGFAVMDPAEWKRRRQFMKPDPVHIESILLDDQILPGIIPNEFVVPTDKHRVEIRFTAVRLQGGKNRYRYRLHGVDKTWVDLGEQRFAVFHGLPPGQYRFQVTAENKSGLMDEEGDTVAFFVQPHWWQTHWFRGGALGLFLAVLWLGWMLARRQAERQKQRREDFSRQLIRSQEDERKRLAVELHDSLGQNLLVAKNQLFLLQSSSTDVQSSSRLDQIRESVNAALEEARSISHNLRPVQLERLGLTKAIRAMVRQFSEATRIPIDARIESVDGLFNPEAEINLYRILQEALTNIFKHADASRIELVVQRQGHVVNLMIRDDGRGFNVHRTVIAGKEARGLGLSGFQERANLLHGSFECHSSPGEGTTLRFHIPMTPPLHTP